MELIKLKRYFVCFLADILPDNCPMRLPFGLSICQLNPLYKEVMNEKLKRLGYLD